MRQRLCVLCIAAVIVFRALPALAQVPGIDNASVAEVGAFSATLNGDLMSTGMAPAEVSVFYGLTDGGFVASSWDQRVDLGFVPEGPVEAVTTNLLPEMMYFFRFYASNSFGEAWAPSSDSFMTAKDWSAESHFHMDIFPSGYTNAPVLNNFPLLVILDDAHPGFSYSQMADPGGGDIRFTDADGRELHYEIEHWNPAGRSFLWVQLPELDNTTTVTMHWGSPSNTVAPSYTADGSTWTAYRGVWHLSDPVVDEQTVGTYNDSSLYNVTGLQYNSAMITGVVANAVEFDGVDDYIEFPDAVSLNPTGAMTISCWVRPDSPGTIEMLIDKSDATGLGGFQLCQNLAAMDHSFHIGGLWYTVQAIYSPSVWQHTTFTFDGSIVRVYVDGVLRNSTSIGGSIRDDTGPMRFGTDCLPGGTNFFIGAVDEVRISSVARSEDWITALYHNQFDNGSFQFYGPVVNTTPQAPGPLLITEIMADPSGLDSDFEWIEVFNFSTGTVDLASYRFREGFVNHMLESLMVPPGSFAIIAQNKTSFLTRYPSLAPITVDSSFSLLNSGELLEMTRGTTYPDDLVDSLEYTTSQGFPGSAEACSIHLNTFVAPADTVDNDMGSNWQMASASDGFSTLHGPDLANPGTASWLAHLPQITVLPASNITASTAYMNGNLLSTGASPTEILIYYGTADAGTDKGLWDGSVALGTAAVGPVGVQETGLAANQVYHYRCYATNAGGDTWSLSSTAFVTLQPVIDFASASSSGSESLMNAGLELVLSDVSAADATVEYSVIGGTASAIADYTLSGGVATITAGTTAAAINFPVTDDPLYELPETVIVAVSNAVGAGLGTGLVHTYTILNDDPLPIVSVGDDTVLEGDSGSVSATFTISLSEPSALDVTVEYTASNASASVGSDFTPITSVATITAGSASVPFFVEVLGDTVDEGTSEFFWVYIWNPVNASLGDNQGVGTITDDDTAMLSYSATTFAEAPANNGTINNGTPPTINLSGDTFVTGTEFIAEGRVTAANVPAGLVPVLSYVSSTQLVVTFSGAATAHADADDVANVTFTFQDTAFATVAAADVTGFTRTDISVDFADPPAGSVTVVFNPGRQGPAAATWRLTSGPDTGPHLAGEVVSAIPAGPLYTVTFGPEADWVTPPDVTNVPVVASCVTTVRVFYLMGEMVELPGGTFEMGIYNGQGGKTTTVDPFRIDTREVSVAHYTLFCADTGRPMPPTDGMTWSWAQTNLPVVNVAWADAQAYAAWAGKRLPTEAEWEYAARGGLADNLYPWGDQAPTAAQANYGNTIGQPMPGGSYPSNGFGIFDVAGNVYEWCYDWYESPLADGTVNPSGPPAGMYHVLRGGSWVGFPTRMRVAVRSFLDATGRHSDLGFRCAADEAPAGIPMLADTLDADADGAPDWWEELHFAGGRGGSAVDASADTDNDGMVSSHEYLAGTDPSDRNSVLTIKGGVSDKAGTSFTITWSSVLGKRYLVERATDLSGTFEVIAPDIVATPPLNEFVDTGITPGVDFFYRVRLQQRDYTAQ